MSLCIIYISKGTQPACQDLTNLLVSQRPSPCWWASPLARCKPGFHQIGHQQISEDWLTEKSIATYLRWLPEAESPFLVSHASSHLYLYNEKDLCIWASPSIQPAEAGMGIPYLHCQEQGPRNPLNKFAFSPIACTSAGRPDISLLPHAPIKSFPCSLALKAAIWRQVVMMT